MNLLTDLLEIPIRLYPDKVALIDEWSEITYGALGQRILRLANGLSALGVRKGDRVALLMNSRVELIEAYFALFRLGAIAVPINAAFQSSEIRYVVRDTEPVALLAEDSLVERVLPLRADIPTVRDIAVVGRPAPETQAYESLLAGQPEVCAAVDCNPDALAMLFYTSGTTGFPKGAMFTHWTTMNMSKGWLYVYHLQPEDRVFVASPCFYVMGLYSTLLPTLEIGATGILPSRFRAGPALEMMSRHRATVITAVPTAFLQMLTLYDPARHPLHLRICLLSGSKPPSILWTRLAETFPGAVLLEVYGLTEAFLVAVTSYGLPRKEGAAGIPGSNLQVKIVDDQGNEVPRGTPGEIIARGCTVTAGYWRRPEETAQAYRDGWFYTGDVGVMDEDGYISVVDRKKDMIITGGHNIYPVEVENTLHSHPSVLHAAVVGVPDELKGELPVAAVVLKPGQTATAGEIIAFCKERIASFKVPRRVHSVEALPMTVTGKVMRRVLRDQLAHAKEEPWP